MINHVSSQTSVMSFPQDATVVQHNVTIANILNVVSRALECIKNDKLKQASEYEQQIPLGPYFDEFRDSIEENLAKYWLEKRKYDTAFECAKKISVPYIERAITSQVEQQLPSCF